MIRKTSLQFANTPNLQNFLNLSPHNFIFVENPFLDIRNKQLGFATPWINEMSLLYLVNDRQPQIQVESHKASRGMHRGRT